MAKLIKPGSSSKSTGIKLTDDDDAFGVNYLHSIIAQCGLPRRSLPVETRTFERRNGSSSLFVTAGYLPAREAGGPAIPLPVPSGTRPRLLLLHACTEAVRTRSPEIDLGKSVSDFLRRLRMPTSGARMNDFRDQMTALALCQLRLDHQLSNGAMSMKPFHIIAEFQAGFRDVEGKRTPWPHSLTLTQDFVDRLRDHAVPLSQHAIASLQSSALALDIYTWLVHRLPRINKPEGIAISWAQLHQQFGQEYRDAKEFRRELVKVLARVRGVYPEARIEEIRGRLKLLPSPSPVKPKDHLVQLPAIKQEPAKLAKPTPPRQIEAKSSSNFTPDQTETKPVAAAMANLLADLRQKATEFDAKKPARARHR